MNTSYRARAARNKSASSATTTPRSLAASSSSVGDRTSAHTTVNSGSALNSNNSASPRLWSVTDDDGDDAENASRDKTVSSGALAAAAAAFGVEHNEASSAGTSNTPSRSAERAPRKAARSAAPASVCIPALQLPLAGATSNNSTSDTAAAAASPTISSSAENEANCDAIATAKESRANSDNDKRDTITSPLLSLEVPLPSGGCKRALSMSGDDAFDQAAMRAAAISALHVSFEGLTLNAAASGGSGNNAADLFSWLPSTSDLLEGKQQPLGSSSKAAAEDALWQDITNLFPQ